LRTGASAWTVARFKQPLASIMQSHLAPHIAPQRFIIRPAPGARRAEAALLAAIAVLVGWPVVRALQQHGR